jgi:hypothetical protein
MFADDSQLLDTKSPFGVCSRNRDIEEYVMAVIDWYARQGCSGKILYDARKWK